MELYKLLSISSVFAYSLLIGCSSSTETTTTSNVPSTPSNATAVNVASAVNGGVASSSFSGNESFTIDGDIAATNFWEGGADGDFVKVEFDQSYSISEITIYTNNTGFVVGGGGTMTTSGIRAQVSNDDITYTEVGIAFGLNAPVKCSSSSFGSGKITCSLASNFDAQYIKVLVTSDFAVTEIYEIEVAGI